MADPEETPHPSQWLKKQDGKYFLVSPDEHGQPQYQELSAEETLRLLNNLIKQYDPDHVPQRNQFGAPETADKTATADELSRRLEDVLQKIYEGTGRDLEATAGIIRNLVTSPEAIRAVKKTVLPAVFWDMVWPNTDEVLARTTPEEVAAAAVSDLTGVANNTDRVIEGADRAETAVLGHFTGDMMSQPGAAGSTPLLASGGAVEDGARAGDPVLPFSGQLMVEALDLEMDGIGIDFQFRRTYLHNVGFRGPFGPRWDHSYNLWLRELVEPRPDGIPEYVVYRSTGALQTERFRMDGTGPAVDAVEADDVEFLSSAGTGDRLQKRGGQFVAIAPDGSEIYYGDNRLAERLRDRNGNEVHLRYDGDRLAEIVDSCGRRVRLLYDDEGRIARLVDDALDRQILYGYDEGGRLQTVRKTVAAGRPPILTDGYRYWGSGAPEYSLQDNIVALVDGRGIEVLQIAYGDERGRLSYNRVVEQRDGGITSYDYEFVFDVDHSLEPPDQAVIRCRLTLPTGDVQLLDYNDRGQLVRLELDDRDPVLPRRLTTRWRYNEDGRPLVEDRPDGSSTEYLYGREVFAAVNDPATATSDERARFGQLRRMTERRRPSTTGPFSRVTEYDYHPVHKAIVEQRGPYYGDVLGRRIGAGPSWDRRFEYDALGQVIAQRWPDCTLPDGSVQPGGLIEFSYDKRGRLTRLQTAIGGGKYLGTEYQYGPALEAAPRLEISDADGLRLTRVFTRDAAGRTTVVETPRGVRQVSVLDHLGRTLVDETWLPGQPTPAAWSFDYGPLALPVRKRLNRLDASGVEDPDGDVIEENTFDLDGDVAESRLRSGDGAIDRIVRYERGPDRRLKTFIAAGVRLETIRDGRGLPLETCVRAGSKISAVQRFRYDALGRLATSTNAAGDETTMRYDGFGRLSETVHPRGTVETFVWDAGDRLLRHATSGVHPDAGPATLLGDERRRYDEAGRLVEAITLVFDPAQGAAGAAQAVTTYEHDRAGRLLAMVDPAGRRSSTTYDGLSRPLVCDDGAGTLIQHRYDDVLGTLDQEIHWVGQQRSGALFARTLRVETRQDARGRTIVRKDALGNEERWEYDSRGDVSVATDPSGTQTIYERDAEGRVRTIRYAAGTPEEWAVEHVRDLEGRLRQVIGPRGLLSQITYDAFGRVDVFGAATPGREQVHLAYDDLGRAAGTSVSSGVTTTFEYGEGGVIDSVVTSAPRPGAVSARTAGERTIRFAYDGAGRLVSADDGLWPVTRRYDSRGSLLREVTGTLTVQWSLDLAGRPATFTFPDGRTIFYERDAAGRLQRLLDRPAGATVAGELLALWSLGSSSFTSQAWRGICFRDEDIDPAGRLAWSRESTGTLPAVLSEIQQISDNRGLGGARRLTVGGRAETTLLSTNRVGRIVGAAFDAAVTMTTPVAATVGAAVSQLDLDRALASLSTALPAGAERLRLSVEGDGARTRFERIVLGAVTEERNYSVDLEGRVSDLASPRDDDEDGLPLHLGALALGYETDGRLRRGAAAGAPAAEIFHDALGRPVVLKVGSVSSRLVHAADRLVEIRDGTAGVRDQLVRLPGGELVEIGTATAPRRVIVDGQGTPVGLVDLTGTVTASAFRDPFGELRHLTGMWPAGVPSFHGLTEMPGTSLLVTPFRTYDSRSGSFLELDPMGFVDGANRALYAGGNPFAFSDPSGLMSQPATQAGRGTGMPHAWGPGLNRPYTWYERIFAASGGAVWAVVDGLLELVKMAADVNAGARGHVLSWVTGVDIDYKAVSGIGQMAQAGKIGGTLDLLGVMGKSIADTPRRVLEAAGRDDPAAVGYEVMGALQVGESAVGLVRGIGNVGVNGGVSLLRRTGPRGARWHQQFREWQLRRMQPVASRLAGASGMPEPTLVYEPVLPGGSVGSYSSLTNTIRISEKAFMPFVQLPAGLENMIGAAAAAEMRLTSALRGNFALRSLAHENFHRFQYFSNPKMYEAFRSAKTMALEFTTPGAPWPGAYNFELTLPVGPLAGAGLTARAIFTLGITDKGE
jgi:RHS repeat-associated protein